MIATIMQKTLFSLFLSIFIANFTIVCTTITENIPEHILVKPKVSELEMTTVGAALIGCAFFATAALMAPETKHLLENKSDRRAWHLPTALVAATCVKLLKSLSTINDSLAPSSQLNLLVALTGGSSSLIAFILGVYAYKKLSHQAREKIQLPKNIQAI